MAEQLDLFPEDKDWDEALTDYCDEQIKKHLDTNAFYCIYEDTNGKLQYCGPWDSDSDAKKAMTEYEGEMVLKCNYRELQLFLMHNNKYITQ